MGKSYVYRWRRHGDPRVTLPPGPAPAPRPQDMELTAVRREVIALREQVALLLRVADAPHVVHRANPVGAGAVAIVFGAAASEARGGPIARTLNPPKEAGIVLRHQISVTTR